MIDDHGHKSGAGAPNRIWVNEFTMQRVESFYDEFVRLHEDESVGIIPVFIASYGGEAFAELAMRDILKSSLKPVATVAAGVACSCGCLLLAAGTKGYRFAMPGAWIMYHEVSSLTIGKTNDIKSDTKMTVELQRQVDEAFCQDTGMTDRDLKKRLRELKNADWWIKPNLAKVLGIVDHVGVPRVFTHPPEQAMVCPKPTRKR